MISVESDPGAERAGLAGAGHHLFHDRSPAVMEPKLDVPLTVGFVSMHHMRDVPGSASVWLKGEFRGDEWHDAWAGRKAGSNALVQTRLSP